MPTATSNGVGGRAARQAALSAYVLHRYDWSESSLILDLFTREQGRIAVAAKGAKRPFSQLRGVLLPLQRLQVSLGRASGGDDEATRDVQTLRGADWVGGLPMPSGAALWSGFYLNELILKLVPRHDPHPVLFDAYADSVQSLARAGDDAAQPALRAFELVLLREIGLLPDLAVETATQRPLDPAGRFRVIGDAGVVAAAEPHGQASATALPTSRGDLLVGLQAALDGRDLEALRLAVARRPAEVRTLLRGLVHYHLGSDDALRTRRVLRDAQALEAKRAPRPA